VDRSDAPRAIFHGEQNIVTIAAPTDGPQWEAEQCVAGHEFPPQLGLERGRRGGIVNQPPRLRPLHPKTPAPA
jgi:hypothetical protein